MEEPSRKMTQAEIKAHAQEWMMAPDNARRIAAVAWEGYRTAGRGAVVAGPLEEDGSIQIIYLSEQSLHDQGVDWPSQTIADHVRRYDPEVHFVVVWAFQHGGAGVVQRWRTSPPLPAASVHSN
jgi:hypothetical protein